MGSGLVLSESSRFLRFWVPVSPVENDWSTIYNHGSQAWLQPLWEVLLLTENSCTHSEEGQDFCLFMQTLDLRYLYKYKQTSLWSRNWWDLKNHLSLNICRHLWGGQHEEPEHISSELRVLCTWEQPGFCSLMNRTRRTLTVLLSGVQRFIRLTEGVTGPNGSNVQTDNNRGGSPLTIHERFGSSLRSFIIRTDGPLPIRVIPDSHHAPADSTLTCCLSRFGSEAAGILRPHVQPPRVVISVPDPVTRVAFRWKMAESGFKLLMVAAKIVSVCRHMSLTKTAEL